MKKAILAPLFAVQFLTRIPVPMSIQPDTGIARYSLFFFPFVGWLLGAVLFSCWWLFINYGMCSPLLIAAVIVTLEAILTGAFHLDGLADTCDGFFSTHTQPDKKLEIMKDSRTGVMGVTALVLALMLKVLLLSEKATPFAAAVLFIYPVIGRWAQVFLFRVSPYVRKGGTGGLFSQGANTPVLVLSGLWLIPCLLSVTTALSLLGVILFLFCFRWYSHAQIGGITGDTLGAATVLSELVFLFGCILFA